MLGFVFCFFLGSSYWCQADWSVVFPGLVFFLLFKYWNTLTLFLLFGTSFIIWNFSKISISGSEMALSCCFNTPGCNPSGPRDFYSFRATRCSFIYFDLRFSSAPHSDTSDKLDCFLLLWADRHKERIKQFSLLPIARQHHVIFFNQQANCFLGFLLVPNTAQKTFFPPYFSQSLWDATHILPEALLVDKDCSLGIQSFLNDVILWASGFPPPQNPLSFLDHGHQWEVWMKTSSVL